jgi:outer membrane immunogenic protein
MNKLALKAAAFLAIGAFGSAQAADLPTPAPTYAAPAIIAPPPDYWSGCFLGAGVDYGVWNQDSYSETDPGHVQSTASTTNGGRGWFGRGQIGCDYKFDTNLGALGSKGVVIGLFGDGDIGSAQKSINVTLLPSPGTPLTGNEKQKGFWAAGARIGLLFAPKFLTYWSAGFTQTEFDQINLASAFGGATSNFIKSNTYNGYFIGSGFEYGFDFLPGFFLKTEYRFSSYQGTDLSVLTPPGALTGTALNSKIYVQTVSSELVYRFNFK